jgi:hypothetical protein
MNCIFICLFLESELDKLYVLLESIFIYGNLGKDQILIYTTESLMRQIKQSHLYLQSQECRQRNLRNNSIVFSIQDNPCLALPCLALPCLDYFDLQVYYEKVLWLDTGCVVKDNLKYVFEVAQENEEFLYVLEENGIHYSTGRFGTKKVFKSNMFLFRQSDRIKKLFDDMRFVDVAPYLVCDRDLFNTLAQVAISNENIYSDKIIHYCDDPHTFLNNRKEATIHVYIQEAKFYILKHLLPLIHNSDELLEGNIFMIHHTKEFSDVFLDKQRNISNVVLNTEIKEVMEIGFNAGFSSLLMLLSNHTLKLTCFDLGEHSYTRPCFEKLKEHFGDRIHLVLGDSTQTLPHAGGVFDLIHIDGGHETEVAECDILQSYRLSKPGTILVMDDYDFLNLHELWDREQAKYKLKALNIRLYPCIYHDIKFV